MAITYLKKSPKTSSTDDTKTTGIVQDPPVAPIKTHYGDLRNDWMHVPTRPRNTEHCST